jgi:chloramphenicol 3-O phosphotransferase
MKWPALILVNGPSSAGKSTLCRTLQAEIESPYLVTGFDDFVFMSAPRYYRGADTSMQEETDSLTALGVEMITTSEPGAPVCVKARFGPVFRKILDAMAPAVRAIVDHGNPVIFDHALHDRAMYESYRKAVTGLDVFSVGVTCPLHVLEARERSRGDRVLGRARGLVEVVHTFCDYDVMVDTGSTTPEACVARILEALAERQDRYSAETLGAT